MNHSFDPTCLETARYFLGKEATREQSYDLAQMIQDVIEGYLATNFVPPIQVTTEDEKPGDT